MPPITDGHSDSRVDLDTGFRALDNAIRRRILVALMTENPRQEDEFETVEFRSLEAERDVIAVELQSLTPPQARRSRVH